MTKQLAKLGMVYTAGACICKVLDGRVIEIIRLCDTPNQIETVIDQIRQSRKGKLADLLVIHAFGEQEYIGRRPANPLRIVERLRVVLPAKW